MKIKDIKELSIDEIAKKIRDTRDELLHIRLRKQTGQLEKPHLLSELRRDIARMETILTEKKKTAEVAAS
jgi:large subunit ribosomal protein L29